MSKELFFMPSRIKSDVGGVPIENKSKPLSLGSLVDAEPCSVAGANLDKRSVAVPVASRLMVPMMFTLGDGIDMTEWRGDC